MTLSVANQEVKQDTDGRYCLNDLHRASGGERKHGPSLWMENQQTKELVAELSDTGIPVSVLKGGAHQGTYVCKELVYAYAMWISPIFHLKVIRTFDQAISTTCDPAIPKTYAAALQLAADQAREIEEKTLLIEDMSPKAEFFDTVTESKDAVDIGTVAKVLNMNIGRTQLFKFLREQSILMSNNQPYQEYIDRGYFRVIESGYSKPDGSSHVSFKTVVYQKGIDFIRRKLNEARHRTSA